MTCSNKEIAQLLPWYINQTLSRDEREKVEQHLSQCSECVASLKELKSFAAGLEKYGDELFGEHIPAEWLVLYAEAKQKLSREQLDFIKHHLQTCEDCNKELEILKQVNQSLTAEKLPWWEMVKERLLPELRFKPALVYAIIILLLLYPAWQGIFQLPQTIKELRKPEVAPVNFQLQPFNERAGTESKTQVEIKPHIKIFSLSFSIPILNSEHIRYDAKILDRHHKVIWQQSNIKSLDQYGTFMLICHSTFFDAGDYILKVEEMNIRDHRVEETFIFPFVLKK